MKAHFYAPATCKVYVKLPDEDRGPGEERMCGLLQKSVYGPRDAAHNWAVAYTAVLDKLGFEKGATSPCRFGTEPERFRWQSVMTLSRKEPRRT